MKHDGMIAAHKTHRIKRNADSPVEGGGLPLETRKRIQYAVFRT